MVKMTVVMLNNVAKFYFISCTLGETFLPQSYPKYRCMGINLCLGIYIAQAEDEEFSVVDAV